MLWVLPLDSAQSADVFYPAECRATGLALFCIHLEEGGWVVVGGGWFFWKADDVTLMSFHMK